MAGPRGPMPGHTARQVDPVSARRVANRILAGAGRPAKLYARKTREMSVSVAPRDHRLLAELLVQSLEQDPNVRSVVNDAAFAAGQRAGDVFPRTVGRGIAKLRIPATSLRRRPHRAAQPSVRTPSRGTIRRWCACGSRPPPEPMLRGDQSDHIGRCAE